MNHFTVQTIQFHQSVLNRMELDHKHLKKVVRAHRKAAEGAPTAEERKYFADCAEKAAQNLVNSANRIQDWKSGMTSFAEFADHHLMASS